MKHTHGLHASCTRTHTLHFANAHDGGRGWIAKTPRLHALWCTHALDSINIQTLLIGSLWPQLVPPHLRQVQALLPAAAPTAVRARVPAGEAKGPRVRSASPGYAPASVSQPLCGGRRSLTAPPAPPRSNAPLWLQLQSHACRRPARRWVASVARQPA